MANKCSEESEFKDISPTVLSIWMEIVGLFLAYNENDGLIDIIIDIGKKVPVLIQIDSPTSSPIPNQVANLRRLDKIGILRTYKNFNIRRIVDKDSSLSSDVLK